jgi:hypothetical protein
MQRLQKKINIIASTAITDMALKKKKEKKIEVTLEHGSPAPQASMLPTELLQTIR